MKKNIIELWEWKLILFISIPVGVLSGVVNFWLGESWVILGVFCGIGSGGFLFLHKKLIKKYETKI